MKKLFIMLVAIASIVCMFAITSSAETSLKPQSTNEYGELIPFDEAIGNTQISDLKDDGTIARTVLTDGNGNYYTIPTVYMLVEHHKTRNDGVEGEMFNLYFDEISAKIGFTVSKNSIVRIEFPSDITFICANNENLSGCANMVECKVNEGLRFWENKQVKIFTNCTSLTSIDLSGMIFEYVDCTYAIFENCSNLVSVKLPDAYAPNGTPVKYNVNYMFGGCTKLETVENFGNLTKSVTSYEQNVFYNCKALYNVTGLITDGVMVVPSNVTYFGNNAFQNCDKIKAIKFTASSAKMLQNVFNSLDSLEYIYFPRDSKLELPSCEVFSSNPELKALALPDNCTSLPDRAFKNCAKLKAVYLPANLATMVTNGWDQSPFTSDPELYFVNEWFDVIDENGEFLLNNFQMPARPEVYYFPSTLTNLCDQKTSATGFYNCYKINPVLVFGTGVTKFIPGDGLLINCGTKGEVKTVVFLGDMTTVCHSSQDSRLQNIQYVFANPNDKTTADVTITNNNTGNPGETAKIFFCATGTSYQMIAKGGTYGENLGEKHFNDVKNSELISPATCVDYAVYNAKCFCNKTIGEVLGTTYDLNNHDYTSENAIIVSINYNKVYTANGVKTITCGRENCGTNKEFTANPLFTTLGYSIKENNGYGIISTYVINAVALKEYEDINGAITFGIIMANANFDGQSAFMSKNDQDKYVLNSSYGVQLEIKNRDYSKVNATIDQFTQDEASLNLVMALYVIEGDNVTYIQHEAAEGVEYAGSVKKDATLDIVTITNIAEINKIKITLPQPAVVPAGNDEE